MLIYYFAIAGLLVWGISLGWRWKEVRAFAPDVLAAKKRDKEIPDDVTDAEFTDLYLRSEGPRGETYFFACAAILFLLLGPHGHAVVDQQVGHLRVARLPSARSTDDD